MNVVFDDNGLVPAVVQDVQSKEVLMLAYMNEASLQKSLESREAWFFSRSRGELWHKGETSGNTQHIVDMRYDCDQDALLVLVEPEGPACHKGNYSCFADSLIVNMDESRTDRFAVFNELESLIAKREAERPEGAYTTYLFREGVDKILKKVGEEAAEVIIASKNREHGELKWEVSDLFYHVLVLLREQKLPLDDVLKVLEERRQKP